MSDFNADFNDDFGGSVTATVSEHRRFTVPAADRRASVASSVRAFEVPALSRRFTGGEQ